MRCAGDGELIDVIMSSQRAKAQPLRPIRSPHNPEDPRTRWSEDTDGYRPSVPWTASFGVVMRRAASGYLQPAESADPDHSIPYAIGGHTTSSSGRRPRDTFTSQLRPAGYSSPTSPALVPELKIANNGEEPSEIVTGARYYSAKMPG